ncbi:MAG: TerB family tellurite resistance protein [Cyclobacteriaceae bacterium]|nr:TerB family tellurite resistance protein [Cyclobacteriaceae bacterium]
MRSIFILLFIIGFIGRQGFAQVEEAEQLMLNYEKLYIMEQTLDEMYNTYRVLEFGYNTISQIVTGNYSLQQAFIDGLMLVNPSIRNYKRIPYIISYQQMLIQEYSRAYDRFRRDPHFTPQELQYLGNVYSYLFTASVRNIDDLLMVITSTKLSMTDDERLRAVDALYYEMESKLRFVRSFNNNTQLLAIQRARSANDARTIQQLYGVY